MIPHHLWGGGRGEGDRCYEEWRGELSPSLMTSGGINQVFIDYTQDTQSTSRIFVI